MWTAERYAKWGKRLLAGGALATALTLPLGVRDCRQRESSGKEFQQAGQEMLMRYGVPIGVSYFTLVCGLMLYMSGQDKPARRVQQPYAEDKRANSSP